MTTRREIKSKHEGAVIDAALRAHNKQLGALFQVESRPDPPDAILVDGLHPGSGTAYDWELLQDIPTDIRLMLSGGLTPENVAAGILQVRPWGVDVSSGVEKSPGQKDAVKMRHFITNARDAVLG